MDLTSAISGLQTAKVMSQIQYAVARKVLDAENANGAAAIKLLEAASKGASQAGDALVTAATGLGGEIDTYG
jgi:hypothetical protein